MASTSTTAPLRGKSPLVETDSHENADASRPPAYGSGGFRPQVPMTVQPARAEDLQKSYASEIQDPDPKNWYGYLINGLGTIIGTMGAIPCCVICPNPFKTVEQGNVGLVTTFGKLYKTVDPGLVRVNPLSEKLIQVDVKIQIVEVPQQVCMTKDNVTVQVTSVVYYHIVSPHKTAFGITDVKQALIERTQTTLRHVIGARELQDVIERREEIAQSIGEIIEDVAAEWGVAVESMLIKDIIFSRELQDSLSMAAQSRRLGDSKIIAARAEVEAATLMRQAADILSSAPAMQIRYLEAMQAMAKSANSKVIFLPGTNGSMPTQAQFEASLNAPGSFNNQGQGSGSQSHKDNNTTSFSDGLPLSNDGFRQALNAHIVENI